MGQEPIDISAIVKAITDFINQYFAKPKPADVIPIRPVVDLRPSDLPQSNHYASNHLVDLAKEYVYVWPLISISDKWKDEAADFAKKALASKARYETVAKVIGCPWWFVAVIHYREASQSWSANIANGDPWNAVTVNVPEGRGPFDSWENAAIDALTYEGYAGKPDWSFTTCLYRLEAYNGFGYRVGGEKEFKCRKQGNRVGTFDGVYTGSMQDTTPRNADPYMYCGTQFYQKGVSIEDHSFYVDAIDDQIGCMVLLKALELHGVRLV